MFSPKKRNLYPTNFHWLKCRHCAASEEDDGIEEEFPTFLKDRNMEPDNFSVIEDTPLIPQDKKEFLSPVVS